MKEVKIVLSKELARIFTDKKMIFSLFVLPVVLIVGMFALMNFMANQESSEIEKHNSVVYAVNVPDTFNDFLKLSQQSVKTIDEKEIDSVKEMLKNGGADLLLVFAKDFDSAISAEKLPNIEMYYNPSENNSTTAFGVYSTGVEAYRKTLQAEKFGSVYVKRTSFG